MRLVSCLCLSALLAATLTLNGGAAVAKDGVRRERDVLALDYVGTSEKTLFSVIVGSSEAAVARFHRRYRGPFGMFYPTLPSVVDRELLRTLVADVGDGFGGLPRTRSDSAILRVAVSAGGRAGYKQYDQAEGLALLDKLARDCHAPVKACADIASFRGGVRRYLGIEPAPGLKPTSD